MKALLILLLCALSLPGCLTVSGMGTPQDDLNSMGVLILERRGRESVSSGLIDGIVFFPPSKYRYVRRQDGDHIVLLEAEEGEHPAIVDSGNRDELVRLIRENGLRERTVAGNVKIYCPSRDCYVFWGRRSGGQLLLQVRDYLTEEDPESFMDLPFK